MFVFLIPILTCLDIILKYAINSMHRKDLPRKLGNFVELNRFHNHGFPFGKLKKRQKLVKYLPVFVTSVLVGAFSFLLPKKGNRLKKVSLGLIIAGSLSNIFDRLARGYVVDYIQIKVKWLDRVIFNLGDLYIILGSAMVPFCKNKNSHRQHGSFV